MHCNNTSSNTTHAGESQGQSLGQGQGQRRKETLWRLAIFTTITSVGGVAPCLGGIMLQDSGDRDPNTVSTQDRMEANSGGRQS